MQVYGFSIKRLVTTIIELKEYSWNQMRKTAPSNNNNRIERSI